MTNEQESDSWIGNAWDHYQAWGARNTSKLYEAIGLGSSISAETSDKANKVDTALTETVPSAILIGGAWLSDKIKTTASPFADFFIARPIHAFSNITGLGFVEDNGDIINDAIFGTHKRSGYVVDNVLWAQNNPYRFYGQIGQGGLYAVADTAGFITDVAIGSGQAIYNLGADKENKYDIKFDTFFDTAKSWHGAAQLYQYTDLPAFAEIQHRIQDPNDPNETIPNANAEYESNALFSGQAGLEVLAFWKGAASLGGLVNSSYSIAKTPLKVLGNRSITNINVIKDANTAFGIGYTKLNKFFHPKDGPWSEGAGLAFTFFSEKVTAEKEAEASHEGTQKHIKSNHDAIREEFARKYGGYDASDISGKTSLQFNNIAPYNPPATTLIVPLNTKTDSTIYIGNDLIPEPK